MVVVVTCMVVVVTFLYASNHPSLPPSHASYEGTGRSLSLKLIDQLRQQSSVTGVSASSSGGASFAG